MSRLLSISNYLDKPFGVSLYTEVSGASLAFVRIGFGMVMLYEMVTMRAYVLRDLMASKFFLTYDLFSWVAPLPMPLMEAVLGLGAIATLFVIIGFKFRIAQTLLAFIWTYIFLLDHGHYNNHYYLYSLLSFVLIFTDAHRNYSLDAALSRKPVPSNVHRWQYLIIQVQVFVLYFYGAIAKLNPDWLRGWPMRKWLREDVSSFPGIYTEFVTSEFGVYFYSYGGIAFDLLIGFALFHRKWRYWALPAIVFFHVSNHYFWNIGSFPWFGILISAIFFNPDWPKKLAVWFGVSNTERVDPPLEIPPTKRFLTTFLFSIYLIVQIVVPLRQFIYKGNPGWHGYGHQFSWHMMLIDSVSGIKVKVKDAGDPEFMQVAMEDYITFRQFRKSSRVPATFLDFAHFIRDEMIKGGAKDPIVRMEIYKSYNGREYTLLTDTTVNYAKVEETYFYVPDWIQEEDPNAQPGALWK